MVYSDVVRQGLILPRKQKYTTADVDKVIANSLFRPIDGRTMTKHVAAFVVRCSAVFHGTDYSRAVGAVRA